MKNFIFISIIILFLGCSEEDDTTIQSQLIGKWKWVESSGGIAGTTENPQSTGKDITVEFTSNTKKLLLLEF